MEEPRCPSDLEDLASRWRRFWWETEEEEERLLLASPSEEERPLELMGSSPEAGSACKPGGRDEQGDACCSTTEALQEAGAEALWADVGPPEKEAAQSS